MSEQPIDPTDELNARRRRRGDLEAVPDSDPALIPPSPQPDEGGPTESAFDIALDPEPTLEPTTGSRVIYADVTSREHERRPIVPAAWRGRDNIRQSLRWHAGAVGHELGYHAVRMPKYATVSTGYAVAGTFRLAGRQIRWWWTADGLLDQLKASNDGTEKLNLRKQIRADRRIRAVWLVGEALVVAGAGTVAVLTAPVWVLLLLLAGLVPPLAYVGRPRTRRIVNRAVVKTRYRRLNQDVVLRAYYAAGLGNPEKPDQRVEFASQMARDTNQTGSHVLIDLPYGKGFDDAAKARNKIASGLDVVPSQVYISRDPSSHRRHVLWVADRDPLAVPAGRTPLLSCKPVDVWSPVPFGVDERGNQVPMSLLWNSFLVGAQPRQGKTFSARALALAVALDPYAKLSVFDGKASPDWRGFSMVADRYGFGITPDRHGDPVDTLLHTLRALKTDVLNRNVRLSELPTDVCPEGKLTREIARNPEYNMPFHLVVIDEFQEYLSLGEQSKEIADLLVFLVKVAPSVGVSVLSSTQRPSGIGGAGPVGQAFTNFRDNHTVRFSLRTGSWQVSDLILGAGAYSEGHDSSGLLPSYKGVGILRGAADDTPTVRTFLADAQDAEKILRTARKLRQHTGTLTGMAAGQSVARERRDVLADALLVIRGDARVSWHDLAARLSGQIPEHYAEITAEAISAQLRALGVTSANVRAGGQVLKGTTTKAIRQAVDRRALG